MIIYKITNNQNGKDNFTLEEICEAKSVEELNELEKKYIAIIVEAMKKPVINLDTGEVFNSVKEASASCGAFDTQITRVCKGKRKHCMGYRWAYYTP